MLKINKYFKCRRRIWEECSSEERAIISMARKYAENEDWNNAIKTLLQAFKMTENELWGCMCTKKEQCLDVDAHHRMKSCLNNSYEYIMDSDGNWDLNYHKDIKHESACPDSTKSTSLEEMGIDLDAIADAIACDPNKTSSSVYQIQLRLPAEFESMYKALSPCIKKELRDAFGELIRKVYEKTCKDNSNRE